MHFRHVQRERKASLTSISKLDPAMLLQVERYITWFSKPLIPQLLLKQARIIGCSALWRSGMHILGTVEGCQHEHSNTAQAQQCALAPILVPASLQHILLCLAFPMATTMADCSESSWNMLQKGLCDVLNYTDPFGTRRFLCLQSLLPSISSHTILLEPRHLACCRHTQVYGI